MTSVQPTSTEAKKRKSSPPSNNPPVLFDPLSTSYSDFKSKTITLPDGLLYKGNLYPEVQVKGLSTTVRKNMSEANIVKNPFKIIDTLLQGCIVSIPGIERVSLEIIQCMTNTDREACQYEIYDLTYGSIKTDVECPHCEQELSINTPLQSVDIKPLPEEVQKNVIEDERLWVFQKEGIGEVRMRLLKGKHMEDIGKFIKMSHNGNDREKLLRVIHSSIFDFNTKNVFYEHVTQWPLYVIDWLEDCIVEMKRGYNSIISESCPECGKEIKFALDIQTFLFQNPSKNSGRNLAL